MKVSNLAFCFTLAFLLHAAPIILATEQGTLIHFPAKMDEDWAPAEAAAKDAAATFGKRSWLRFDNLWHEQNWEPFAPAGHARMAKIIGICKRENLRPLMSIIPHPWPGSPWFASYKPARDWGDPEPGSFPWITRRYAETIVAYRATLKANGIAESDAAVQFGNEPASGHPGGNGTLPEGTWSAQPLWAQINAACDYGALNVISPALSMQDHKEEVAARERDTAAKDSALWSAPVTNFALHNRIFRPDLAGQAYADDYIRVLSARAATVANLWPKGTGTIAHKRAAGVWVTEGYIAVGDSGGDRAEAARALAQKIKAGVPGVAVFIWYRWFPSAPEGQVQWQFDEASRKAIGEGNRP
jgi:hypothetical protein